MTAKEKLIAYDIGLAVWDWFQANATTDFWEQVIEEAGGEEAADRTLPVGIRDRAVRDREALRDLLCRLVKYGSWSTAQQSLVVDLWRRVRETDVRAEAERYARTPHVESGGNQTITGEVVSVREPNESARFPAWKMLVKDDQGRKYWGSIPKALISAAGEPGQVVGKRVTFTASVTRSAEDVHFGLFSRPKHPAILGPAK